MTVGVDHRMLEAFVDHGRCGFVICVHSPPPTIMPPSRTAVSVNIVTTTLIVLQSSFSSGAFSQVCSLRKERIMTIDTFARMAHTMKKNWTVFLVADHPRL